MLFFILYWREYSYIFNYESGCMIIKKENIFWEIVVVFVIMIIGYLINGFFYNVSVYI